MTLCHNEPFILLFVFSVVANCIPQCQNGGMCLRPQLCICKPGSKGQACEQTTVPSHPHPALPGNGPTNGHTAGHTNVNNVVPQRPIPQQVLPNGHAAAPPSGTNMAQMKLTVKAAPQFVRPHYIQQHIQQQWVPGAHSHLIFPADMISWFLLEQTLTAQGSSDLCIKTTMKLC